MDEKDVQKILAITSAINSDLKISALRSLCSGPKNLKEVIHSIESLGHKVRYRETVYRSLERLTDARLLEKSYLRGKGVVYILKKKQIVITLCQ